MKGALKAEAAAEMIPDGATLMVGGVIVFARVGPRLAHVHWMPIPAHEFG